MRQTSGSAVSRYLMRLFIFSSKSTNETTHAPIQSLKKLQFFSYGISVDAKLSAGRLKDDVLARITVAMPKPRDSTIRLPTIPASVSAVKMVVENGERVTEKTLMLNNG